MRVARFIALGLVWFLSGCAARHAYLDERTALTASQDADVACGPVGLRRVSLGSRWGEFVRVRVQSPTPVRGVLRVHVAGRPEPAKPFEFTRGSSAAQFVHELTWENELLSVPWGLAPEVVIDFTVTDVHTPNARCGDVSFLVEQGSYVARDEKVWLAELERRGGPDVEAWRRSQILAKPPQTPKVQKTTPALARTPSPSQWTPWTKEDAVETESWSDWPVHRRLEVTLAGPPVARGSWVVLAAQADDVLRAAQATAATYRVAMPATPVELGVLLERLRFDLESEDAAVLALFAGLPSTQTALRRARAARVPITLESLVRFFPTTLRSGTQAATEALGFATAYGLGWPVKSARLSSPFGFRTHPTLGGTRLHTGVDLSVPEGTSVFATADGVVVRAAEDSVSGRYVVIDHGRGVTTAYCHNSEVVVAEGQFVARGELVSRSGNTGRSTGPHLHYQLELARRPMDPLVFRRGDSPVSAPATTASR